MTEPARTWETAARCRAAGLAALTPAQRAAFGPFPFQPEGVRIIESPRRVSGFRVVKPEEVLMPPPAVYRPSAETVAAVESAALEYLAAQRAQIDRRLMGSTSPLALATGWDWP